MIATERAFSKMCISRGFARLAPRFYARCIGDGVYQTIYTGFQKYIDPESPAYSSNKRKSYYISIGLRSVYTWHDEHTFIPGRDSGGFKPADLRDRRKSNERFNGIEEEYSIMEEVGFDVLDSINTQEAFLEWWEKVQTADTGRRIHDLQLAAPFLLCGMIDEAETEISVSYIHSADAYNSYLQKIEEGYIQVNQSYEQRVLHAMTTEMMLWRWCIGRNYEKLNAYINENFQRNIAWIQKYAIPFDQGFAKRILVKSAIYDG